MPARQQALRATIDWSYQLLGPDEQTLFARLAVFHSGCTLEAAEAICGEIDLLTGLSILIDNNLLRQAEQPDGEPRFWMLETVRAYARERLETRGEAEEISRRHAEYFLAVAEQSEHVWRKGDVDLLSLERDHDNFRAALTGLVARDDRESMVHLVDGLLVFWSRRGHLREGMRWSDKAVELAAELTPSLQARAWFGAACATRQQDLGRARELGQQALGAFSQQ
jgi:predicted ATPase